jgi:hypothetical protein
MAHWVFICYDQTWFGKEKGEPTIGEDGDEDAITPPLPLFTGFCLKKKAAMETKRMLSIWQKKMWGL